MARSRAKKAEAQIAEPDAATAEDTSFNPIDFDPELQRTAGEIIHAVNDATRMPDTQPEERSAYSHTAAVERKPLPRPADPFPIAVDLLAGVRLSESRRFGKMLIGFDEKPSPEVISKLKDEGFRWEPLEKVWTVELGDRPMSARIAADETFKEVSKLIRSERGIEHSAGVAVG